MLKENQIKKLVLAVCLVCSAGVGAIAGTAQRVTINGEEVSGKAVSTITFSGDDAILTYTDNTTATAPMEQVVVVFSDSGTTGVDKLVVAEHSSVVDGKLTLGGVKRGTIIRIYDMSTRKKLSVKATSQPTTIDVSSLPSGTYIMSAGSLVVKFMKQ